MNRTHLSDQRPTTVMNGGTPIPSLSSDERGMAMVEYSILIGTIALGSAVAFIAVGAAFVRNFEFVRGLILCPFP